MSSTATSQKTFEKIALCLSGGGYRASAFHFGTLDMLDELGLLENVRIMSTASGGTITGVAYALSKVEGQRFEDFFTDFYDFITKTNVILDAVEKAADAVTSNPSKNTSLIRHAAEVYDEQLFGNVSKLPENSKRFDIFRSVIHAKAVDPLFDDLIFNAMELHLGNSFRFRATTRKSVENGNQAFSVQDKVSKTVTLGDIVAASSCFPGAFDPFVFPDDFHLDVPRTKADLASGFKDDVTGKDVSLPLMDGGIFDNQGVYGVLLSSSKSAVNLNPDLVIIGDSNPLKTDLFPAPAPKWSKNSVEKYLPSFMHGHLEKSTHGSAIGLITRGKYWLDFVLTVAFWLCLLSVVCLIFLGIFVFQNSSAVFGNLVMAFFAFVIPGATLALTAVVCAIGSNRLVRLKERLDETAVFIDQKENLEWDGYPAFPIWRLAKRSNMLGVIRLLETRINSSLALTTDVFLKRIRNLGTNLIKKSDEIGHHVTFNYITDLDHYNNVQKRDESDKDTEIEPTDELIAITNKAGEYQTNLWCTSPAEIENVIYAGQISICYSLLRHFWDRAEGEKRKAEKENKEKLDRGCNEPLIDPLPSLPNAPGYEYQELYDKVKSKWVEFKSEERKSYKRLEKEP